jgi:hypothetical protein
LIFQEISTVVCAFGQKPREAKPALKSHSELRGECAKKQRDNPLKFPYLAGVQIDV